MFILPFDAICPLLSNFFFCFLLIISSDKALDGPISKEYKLADAKQAHEDLESRKLTGPAILLP